MYVHNGSKFTPNTSTCNHNSFLFPQFGSTMLKNLLDRRQSHQLGMPPAIKCFSDTQ